MGSKKVIPFLFILLSLNVLETYGQDGYVEKIEWVSMDSLITFVHADTCDIKEKSAGFGYSTKTMTINNSCYFFVFLPYGSGESLWFIGIFKQEYDLWRMVAKGNVASPQFFITADLDLSKNTIVFYTLNPEIDPYTGKMNEKHLIKVEEIGELSFDDL